MQVRFQFEYNKGLSWPELLIRDTVDATMSDVTEFKRRVYITCAPAQNSLLINRINKTGSETLVKNGVIIRDQTVTLEKIWVDDILVDLDLILQLSVFVNDFPSEYLEYCKTNNIESAPRDSHWPIWYFNGTWEWSYQVPFWNWYATEKIERQSRYHFGQNRELYIGTNAKDHRELLDELKKRLADHV